MREDLFAAQAVHRFFCAEDRTPERMIGPERGHEDLVHQIVGSVLDHLDFLEDDGAL